MISNRQWISICLAGLCWGGIAVAQNAGGAAAGGSAGGSGASSGGSSTGGSTTSGSDASGPSDGSGTPASGTKGTDAKAGGTSGDKPANPSTPGGATPPKTGGSVDPFIPTTPKTDGSSGTNGPGASSSFGAPPEKQDETGPSFTKPGDTAAPADSASGPSSAFGPGDSTSTTQSAPPSFTLPGFFGGGGSSTYTGGSGRMARPRFRYKVTVSQGYDDNVLQTPSDPQKFPDVQVLVDPGTPDTFGPVTRIVGYEQAFAGPIVYYRPITRTTFERIAKGRAPVLQTIRAPAPQERTGSGVSRLGLHFDTQQVSRRSLFTVDLNGSADYYWDRPGSDGNTDYSGSFSLAYLYNITPRLSTSLTANIAYISQPDFTRINTPNSIGAGDLVNALARLNVSYRLTPRFSTTLSVGQNAIMFVNQNSATAGANNNGDSYETTFSAEARYLWKPRYTLLAEFRHVLINYPDTPSVNAASNLLLVGAEVKLSSRLSGTLRLGESIRVFDESGDSSSSPYGEAQIAYRIGPTSSLQWNSRFGYEEPPGAGSEVLSYRTTLNYFKSFTPRLSLSAGITGVSRNTTFRGADDQSEQDIDANIALEYHFTKQFKLNTSFSFTKVLTSDGNRDYDRSRIFIGAEYEF